MNENIGIEKKKGDGKRGRNWRTGKETLMYRWNQYTDVNNELLQKYISATSLILAKNFTPIG